MPWPKISKKSAASLAGSPSTPLLLSILRSLASCCSSVPKVSKSCEFRSTPMSRKLNSYHRLSLTSKKWLLSLSLSTRLFHGTKALTLTSWKTCCMYGLQSQLPFSNFPLTSYCQNRTHWPKSNIQSRVASFHHTLNTHLQEHPAAKFVSGVSHFHTDSIMKTFWSTFLRHIQNPLNKLSSLSTVRKLSWLQERIFWSVFGLWKRLRCWESLSSLEFMAKCSSKVSMKHLFQKTVFWGHWTSVNFW